MPDPITAALNRLQEYAAAHPEHDTDELVAQARAAAAEGVSSISEPSPVATDVTPVTPEEIQKRIELRVSQSFFDAVKLLADTENVSRADIIRKAVSLYARARVEQKKGNFVAFARMSGDNAVEVTEMLSVV